MRKKLWLPVSLLLMLLLSTACQPAATILPNTAIAQPTTAAPASENTPESKSLPTVRTLPEQPTIIPPKQGIIIPIDPSKDAVAQAVDDLAQRIGVDAASIEVLSVEADDLPALGLGCVSGGQKDQPELPAFVMGKIIVLKAGEAQYEYHTHGGVLAYCGQN